MTIQISNASPLPLMIWIEPWCDELALPSRSVLSLAAGDRTHEALPDMEVVDDRLAVWATVAGTLIVAIDGIEQDTASRTIALPAELFEIPVKTFVNTAFGGQPFARVAGAPITASPPRLFFRLWHRAKAFLPPWIRVQRRP